MCTGKRTKMIIVVSQALSQVQQPHAPRGGQGKLPVEVKCICKLCLTSHKRVPWSFPRDADEHEQTCYNICILILVYLDALGIAFSFLHHRSLRFGYTQPSVYTQKYLPLRV